MTHPAVIAARYLYGKLAPGGITAASLSAAGVVGVWPDVVPEGQTWGTAQTPRYHVIYAVQGPGVNVYAVGAIRLSTDPIYQVAVVGRVRDIGRLDAAATAIDALLHATEGPVSGGYVDSCVQEAPLAIGPLYGPGGGVVTFKLGGLYRLATREA